MANKVGFSVVSLIAMMAACPAFSATTATQDWVKNRYDGPLNTINNRLATDVRDKIYTYDKNTKTVSNPLHTTGQNAFDGVNEVLEMVNGNDGTANSEVQLETTAQNAFGAINELKDEIASLQSQVNAKVSSADLSSAVSEAVRSQVGEDIDTVYDAATGERKSVIIVDVDDFDLDDIKPNI